MPWVDYRYVVQVEVAERSLPEAVHYSWPRISLLIKDVLRRVLCFKSLIPNASCKLCVARSTIHSQFTYVPHGRTVWGPCLLKKYFAYNMVFDDVSDDDASRSVHPPQDTVHLAQAFVLTEEVLTERPCSCELNNTDLNINDYH